MQRVSTRRDIYYFISLDEKGPANTPTGVGADDVSASVMLGEDPPTLTELQEAEGYAWVPLPLPNPNS